MIKTHDSMRVENREQMRGGPGNVRIQHIVEQENLAHARLLAEIVLEPGDGIGPHQHQNETEYYYILAGSGTVTEDDGDKQVAAGDVVITGNGASHSIINTGTDTLRFLALILLD